MHKRDMRGKWDFIDMINGGLLALLTRFSLGIFNEGRRRYVTADAMGMAKVRGKLEGEECRWCRNRVGNKHGERHHDVPRFRALLRDNTSTPACFFYINAPGYNNSSVYSGEGERCRGLALLLP